MSDIRVEEQSKSVRIKTKVKHEMREGLIILSYVGVFLFAFSTYRILLLHQLKEALPIYGSALIQASVLTKVIMIGQAFKLGRGWESHPLLRVSVLKAAVFALLAGIFKVIEDVVKGLIHGEGLAGALGELGGRRALEILVFTILFFCVLIPFFALMETRREMGEEAFEHLFIHRRREEKRAATGYL
jgi:hypothetical protein